MNLVSSESDESDDDHVEDIDHECCRDGLYVAQTRLSEDSTGWRRGFLGLFTRRKIKKGEFIGFYTGQWYTERAYNRLHAAQRTKRDEYAISSSSGLILSPPIGQNRRPIVQLSPLSMANEPSHYKQANAILREYSFNFDEIENGIEEARFDEDFDAIGLIACRDIGRNREILWYYGAAFPRPYNVGKQCKLPVNEEDPLKMFGYIPLIAVPHFIHS
jgi:hypothetical protein